MSVPKIAVKIASITVFFALLSSCRSSKLDDLLGGPFGTCGADHWEAVGKKIFPIFYGVDVGSIERAAKIVELKKWASLKDRCDRANYLSWLEYLERGDAQAIRLRKLEDAIPNPPKRGGVQ